MKKNISTKKELKAFITVEYTCLIGLIFLIYSFLLSVGIFWYNQCVLQSNVKLLALEGMHLGECDGEEKIAVLRRKENRLYSEKYLFTEEVGITYKVKGNFIQVTGEGAVGNSLFRVGIGEEQWDFLNSCNAAALQSADTLRMCKHVLRLGENLIPEIKNHLEGILDFGVFEKD